MTTTEEQDLRNEIKRQFSEIRELLADARFYQVSCLQQIDTSYDEKLKIITDSCIKTINKAKEDYFQKIEIAQDEVRKCRDALNLDIRSWDEQEWSDFLEGIDVLPGEPHSGIRIGTLHEQNNGLKERSEIPALVPFLNDKHILITSTEASKLQALKLLQSLIIRSALSVPKNVGKLIIIDKMFFGRLGTNFPIPDIRFMLYKDLATDEISKSISRLIEYIRNGVIEDNQPNQHLFVCIADFPAGFDENDIRELNRAIKNENINVSFVINVNTDLLTKEIEQETLRILENVSSVISITSDSNRFRLGEQSIEFFPDNKLSDRLRKDILHKIAEHYQTEEHTVMIETILVEAFKLLVDNARNVLKERAERRAIEKPNTNNEKTMVPSNSEKTTAIAIQTEDDVKHIISELNVQLAKDQQEHIKSLMKRVRNYRQQIDKYKDELSDPLGVDDRILVRDRISKLETQMEEDARNLLLALEKALGEEVEIPYLNI